MSAISEQTSENGSGRRNPVEKAMLVVELMAEDPGRDWGVREIATELGWTPSTLHRILVLLEQGGWISSPSEGRYSLGIRFLKLTLQASNGFPLQEIGRAGLYDLVEETGETAVLSVYDAARQEMSFVATVDSPQPVRYVADLLNTWMPIYAGATGHAILAFLPAEERWRVIHGAPLRSLTDRTIVDPDKLEKHLEQVRKDGYAWSAGERTPGAVGVGAPIFGPDGRVLGEVSLTVPELRFDRGQLPQYADAVVRCAADITNALGDPERNAATEEVAVGKEGSR